MKNLASWLITIFVIMFWIFRLIVTYMSSIELQTPFAPTDMITEIIVLFISIVAILLYVKRNFLGAIIYAIAYGYYFGVNAFNSLINLINNPTNLEAGTALFAPLVALVLVVCVLLDLALNKDKHEGRDKKNTHWFYKDKKYERKLDERADKNQYKFRN